MKVLSVMSLISVIMFLIIVLLDLLMWNSLNIWSILKKEVNFLEVMGPAEYFIIMMIIFQFVVKAIVGFVKKKKQNDSSQNKTK